MREALHDAWLCVDVVSDGIRGVGVQAVLEVPCCVGLPGARRVSAAGVGGQRVYHARLARPEPPPHHRQPPPTEAWISRHTAVARHGVATTRLCARSVLPSRSHWLSPLRLEPHLELRLASRRAPPGRCSPIAAAAGGTAVLVMPV